MSNQFGLMLSMIFLSLFIILSGEVLAYQQVSAIAMSNTSIVAEYIEKNGYDYLEVSQLKSIKYFDRFTMSIGRDLSKGMATYTLTTYKKYQAFSKVYSFMSKDITCIVTICRKEYYG